MEISKENNELIEKVANGYPAARRVLTRVLRDHTDKFGTLVIDLQDMHMSGEQVTIAYSQYCHSNIDRFIVACASRNESMVDHVNARFKDRTARRFEPEVTRPKVDAAISSIINEAKDKGALEIIEEGAEHVHNYFLGMLAQMQKSGSFEGNQKFQLATHDVWAVFAMKLAEFQNAAGQRVHYDTDAEDWVPVPEETPIERTDRTAHVIADAMRYRWLRDSVMAQANLSPFLDMFLNPALPADPAALDALVDAEMTLPRETGNVSITPGTGNEEAPFKEAF